MSTTRPTSTVTPIYQVRGLTRRYGSLTVLDGIDFDLHPGECLVILGRSGSGKSVTLRQLNGLEKPNAGSVLFDGHEITTLSESQLLPVRQRVAMLFQSGALFDSMNVYENIAFPLREHTDLDEAGIAAKVAEKLANVRLAGIENHVPSSLSGGMRKRVALARSLALDPEVVLFDEPTTGLDPMTSATIASLILATRDSGVTSIVVTHDLALARRVGNRLAFLDGGRFRYIGDWAGADASSDPILHRFLAGEEEEEEEEESHHG